MDFARESKAESYSSFAKRACYREKPNGYIFSSFVLMKCPS